MFGHTKVLTRGLKNNLAELNLPASISGSASKLPLQSVVAGSANNDGIMQGWECCIFIYSFTPTVFTKCKFIVVKLCKLMKVSTALRFERCRSTSVGLLEL